VCPRFPPPQTLALLPHRDATHGNRMRMQHALLSILLAAAAAEEEVPDGMVRIKGGKFVMGIAVQDSRDSLAQQAVEVREFFLDKTATTNWQFRAFRKATSYQTESQSFGWSFVLELHATEEAKVSLALGLELGPHLRPPLTLTLSLALTSPPTRLPRRSPTRPSRKRPTGWRCRARAGGRRSARAPASKTSSPTQSCTSRGMTPGLSASGRASGERPSRAPTC